MLQLHCVTGVPDWFSPACLLLLTQPGQANAASANEDATTMSGCDACMLFLITARIIGPSSCTREHEASIGKREMSLTMCGHVQLTSEARYKYSDVAHYPSLMLCRTQNLCDHRGPAQAECTSSHPRVCARNANASALVNKCRHCVFIL